jgi:hypothetical protein
MARNDVLKSFFPDEADSIEHEVEIEELQEKYIEPRYDDEFKYMNKSPMELKRLAEAETNPEELKTIQFALSCQRPRMDCEVGVEPFRGENLDAREIEKLSDLIDPANRDTEPFPVPRAIFTEPSKGSDSEQPSDTDYSLFDFDLLQDLPKE